MKDYELTYFISPDVSEGDLEGFVKKISGFVLEEEGAIEKEIKPSKKKMGYFIQDKEEAFLATLNFSLSPEKLGNLKRKLKSENQILRQIILTKKPVREHSLRPKHLPGPAQPLAWKRKEPEKISTKKDLTKKTPETPRKIIKPEKVELEEIDKKIEEILNE